MAKITIKFGLFRPDQLSVPNNNITARKRYKLLNALPNSTDLLNTAMMKENKINIVE